MGKRGRSGGLLEEALRTKQGKVVTERLYRVRYGRANIPWMNVVESGAFDLVGKVGCLYYVTFLATITDHHKVSVN